MAEICHAHNESDSQDDCNRNRGFFTVIPMAAHGETLSNLI